MNPKEDLDWLHCIVDALCLSGAPPICALPHRQREDLPGGTSCRGFEEARCVCVRLTSVKAAPAELAKAIDRESAENLHMKFLFLNEAHFVLPDNPIQIALIKNAPRCFYLLMVSSHWT